MKSLEVVIAIISDGKDKLLFQHRKRQSYQNYLGLVGGKVKQGESLEIAMSREIKEETSLDVSQCAYLGRVIETLIAQNRSSKVLLHVFVVKVDGQLKSSMQEGDLLWVKKDCFLKEKERYIPTDWLIVQSFISEHNLLTRILIENKGEKYEIKSTN